MIKIDGKRRVGKTFLVNKFLDDKKQLGSDDVIVLKFIGGYSKTLQENLLDNHFLLVKQFDLKDLSDSLPKPKTWLDFFNNLNELIKEYQNHKFLIFFDEISWFDKRSIFINSFATIYNLFWAMKTNLMIFMATSVSSWFATKLNKMKELYSRFTLDITIKPFTIDEIYHHLKSKQPNVKDIDIIKYYLMFGGILNYYSHLSFNQTYEWNIHKLVNSDIFKHELNHLFENLFPDNYLHMEILKILCQKNLQLLLKFMTNCTAFQK